MVAAVQNGSFGPVASNRQGSPKGTAMSGVISARFLGGVSGLTLGNISSNLPVSGSVTTQVNAGGTTPAQAASQIAATKATRSPNITYIAVAIAALLVIFLAWK